MKAIDTNQILHETPPPARLPKPARWTERTPAEKTLLVVDDEQWLRELMVQILDSNGYHVLQAGSVEEALRTVNEATDVHLLVTDYTLPDGDGFDIARRFRARHPKAPILLVSGSVSELDGRTRGMKHFAMMEKPFQFCDLLRVIRGSLADTPARK